MTPSRPWSPTLPQLGPAIRWLRTRHVSPDRLAAVFGTTSDYIRLLDYRARHPSARAPRKPAELLGVRRDEQVFALSEAKCQHLDALEVVVDRIKHEAARDGQFLTGITRLRRIQARIGYPSDLRLVRLRARVYQHLAWCAVHAGRTGTALGAARFSIRLSRLLARQSDDPIDRQRLAAVALTASNAALLEQRPRGALQFLDLSRDVLGTVALPGVEYYRQRGVALFQAGADDDDVARVLVTAMEAMTRTGQTPHPIQLAMTGPRHLHLLRSPSVDVEGAQELMAESRGVYRPDSLQVAMTTNWAAACALSTDSPTRHAEALEWLGHEPTDEDPRFGHQATVASLLRLTPALGLSATARTAWVRYALYINAFRHA